MNYAIYKLKFTAPVHLEAVQMGTEQLDELVSAVKTDAVQLSDAFPYIGDKFLIPKPHVFIEHSQDENSSIIKKAYKKLKYITIDDFESYLNGTFDVLNAVQMSELGVSSLKISASIRNGTRSIGRGGVG